MIISSYPPHPLRLNYKCFCASPPAVAPTLLFVAPNPLFFVAPSLFFIVTPSLPFFVAPSASEGSLGTYAPREDILGRRPERSEGSLATLGTTGGRGMTGCGDFSLRSKRQKRAVAPSPFFRHPEAQAEGSPCETPSRTK